MIDFKNRNAPERTYEPATPRSYPQFMTTSTETVLSVIGLGKLGTPLLCVLSKYYRVVGVDTDPVIRNALEKGTPPYYEEQVGELLVQNRANYSVTPHIETALKTSSVLFVVAPTPSSKSGGFDCGLLADICKKIGHSDALRPDHLIVIVSTLMPSQMDSVIIPALESGGKRLGTDFTLCYSPSFIALGTVVKNILCPDLVLIGECSDVAGERLEKIHHRICTHKPPILRMNFINAEIIKLALNSFITTKISYANMVTRLCEKLPGADAEVVLSSIGLDRRVGNAYFKGGIGYGGPCFPRDNLALMATANEAGADASIAKTVHEFNQRQPDYLHQLISTLVTPSDRIGMLGITYKPGTHSVENSQSWSILQHLAMQYTASFYDPAAIVSADSHLKRFMSMADCIKDSSVVIIGTPWEEFHGATQLLSSSTTRCVIDFWNLLPRDAFGSDVRLIQLGKRIA